METSPEHNFKQARRAKPTITIEEMENLDHNELLDWILIQRPKLLKGENLQNFQRAEISGELFLDHAGDVGWFENRCKLPIGPGEILAKLAAEVAGIDIPGIKRYRQQDEDAAISSPASKKPRRESEADEQLQMLARNARRQRECIRQEIEKLNQPSLPLSEDINLHPNAVFQLSNPAFNTKFPFPFVGQMVPDRFQVNGKANGKDNEKKWFYMGREKFAEVREKFEEIRDDQTRSDLMVYGTRGYGKSHLLAALVCYWAAGDRKVVYIPDCRYFIKDPVQHMKAAMLFAWADDESKQQTIIGLDTEDEINRFFRVQKDVIFVIDQLNALEKEKGDDDFAATEKARLRRWLYRCRALPQHKAILSSSANNHSILNTSTRQDNTEKFFVYGGLTRREMDHWWERKAGIELGEYTQDEVEDFTGCIPWFLEKCIVGGKIDLEAKFFTEIDSQAAAFEQDIQAKADERDVVRHYEYMRACLFGLPVRPSSKDMPELVDHRYFYDEFDSKRKKFVGHYTCGICRNAVASMILENRVRFDKGIVQSLPKYSSNPSVTGFVIEQAVLSSIALKGLNITSALNQKMDVTFFEDDIPSFDTTKKKPVLYIPKVFNYRNIDGIIIRIAPKPKIKKQKQKLFMYPLQITLAPDRHSSSRGKFFREWKKWTKGLQDFDVVPQFLWISPNEAETKEHLESPQWPAHNEQNVPISHVSRKIWNWYDEGKQSERITP